MNSWAYFILEDKSIVLHVCFFIQKMKAESSRYDRYATSPSQDQEHVPSSCEFEISPFIKGKGI